MAFEILVPRFGWNMEEGKFLGWLKNDGDEVKAGDALFSLETDKATEEVESFDDGVLHILPGGPDPGVTVSVGLRVAYILTPGEEPPSAAQVAVSSASAAPAAAAEGDANSNTAGSNAPVLTRERSTRGPAISPRARRVAKQLGVEWTQLKGSGRTGRIVERDVRTAAKNRGAAASVAIAREGIRGRLVPLSARQQAAAEKLTTSAAIPTVTLHTEADATELVTLRNELRSSGGAPSFTDLFVKLSASALREHSLLNASWQNGSLFIPDEVNIGIAVDTDAGLVVPVVRVADEKSLDEITAATQDAAAKARADRLRLDDLQGGTFTITNLGMYSVDDFTPLLNPPQGSILGIGRIVRKPSVHGEQVVPRDRISLSLTFDHRVADGAPAARFLDTVVRSIEAPRSIL